MIHFLFDFYDFFLLSYARVNRTCFNECRDQTEWITFFKVIVAYVAAMQSKAKGKILKSVEKKIEMERIFVALLLEIKG